MASFKIHFLILNHSGPGDAQMSSLFQANLIGNDFAQNPLGNGFLTLCCGEFLSLFQTSRSAPRLLSRTWDMAGGCFIHTFRLTLSAQISNRSHVTTTRMKITSGSSYNPGLSLHWTKMAICGSCKMGMLYDSHTLPRPVTCIPTQSLRPLPSLIMKFRVTGTLPLET